VTFDNSLADRQAYALPGVFILRVNPVENLEDSLVVLRVDSDSVVTDEKEP